MPLFGKKKQNQPPSLEQVAQAVLDFINADTWNEGKRIVEERRDLLLTDAADRVFAMLLEQYRGSPDAVKVLERHRDLLRRCRVEGIDAAFAPLLAPREMPAVPPELVQRLLSVSSEEELKALLAEHPELLPLIEQMMRQAQAGPSAGGGDDDELRRILDELSQPPRSPLDMPRRVELCRRALELVGRASQPELWAALQAELADSLAQNPQGERAENLEEAIRGYDAALEVMTREAMPVEWAQAMTGRANAYSDRIRGERAENLEEAIRGYDAALEVVTREAMPIEWAMVQMNRAAAYGSRIRGERAENLEEAIRGYDAALKVMTREALPSDHRLTQRNLGNLYFGEGRWNEALEAYRAAIAAGDDLLQAAYTEAGRRAEVGETAQLYANAAYCLLQSGQPAEALLTHERGKTRLLAEALALAEADLSMLPQAQQAQVRTARDDVRALEAEMRLPADTPARRDDRALTDLLRQARAHLNALIEAIRQDHPDFMPQGLDLPGLLALVPEGGVLVAPLITSQGSVVFVVPHGVTEVGEEHVIRLQGFKEEHLSEMLRGPADDPAWGGWMGAYFKFRGGGSLPDWQAAIERFIGELWEALLAPVHERLQALGVQSVILMPAGGLQLLPLHAAWRMENGEKRTFLDDYEVVYAPSGYALDVSRRRAAKRDGRSALVAGINEYADPQVNPLVNAVAEAEAVAGLLQATPLLDAAATRQAVKAGAAGRAFLHLSCHGYFAWGDPLASGLVCHDAPLTLKEIIGKLNLDACRLVTLSACETGLTEVRQSPDEYVGLPAGFLQAGAPAVIGSLWTVDDRSTALLMERFYRHHFEGGMAFAAALREAQLWLRGATRQELGDYYKAFLARHMSVQDAQAAAVELIRAWPEPDDKPYESPFYWAAFTFSGAG